MATHIAQLKETLSQALSGAAYDPRANTPEMQVVRALAEAVGEYDVGNISLDELEATFAQADVPGFDFGLWYSDQVGAGVYTE